MPRVRADICAVQRRPAVLQLGLPGKAREQCKARQEAAKEKKKNAGKDLETVVAQAERLGMSYGKYRAMQAISAASIHAKTT